MGYRDDSAGLRKRIGRLKSELESVHQDLAAFRGEVVPADVEVTEEAKRGFLRPNTSFCATQQLDFKLHPEAYEEITALLHGHLGATSRKVEGRLLCRHHINRVGVDIEVAPKHDGTVFRVSGRASRGWLDWWMFSGLAAGGITLTVLDALAGVSVMDAWWMTGAAVATAALATWGITRKVFWRQVERERKKLFGILAMMVEIAERHQVAPSNKVQVPQEEPHAQSESTPEEVPSEVSGSSAHQV